MSIDRLILFGGLFSLFVALLQWSALSRDVHFGNMEVFTEGEGWKFRTLVIALAFSQIAITFLIFKSQGFWSRILFWIVLFSVGVLASHISGTARGGSVVASISAGLACMAFGKLFKLHLQPGITFGLASLASALAHLDPNGLIMIDSGYTAELSKLLMSTWSDYTGIGTYDVYNHEKLFYFLLSVLYGIAACLLLSCIVGRLNEVNAFYISLIIYIFLATFLIFSDVTTGGYPNYIFIVAVLLPLINLPFDLATVATSRWLIRKGLKRPSLSTIAFATLDAILALALFALLFLAIQASVWVTSCCSASSRDALGFDFQLLNNRSFSSERENHYSIGILSDAKIIIDIAGAHLWLFLLLLSTILPTLWHLVAASFSFGSVVLTEKSRGFLVRNLGQFDSSFRSYVICKLLLGAITFLTVSFPLLIFILIASLMVKHWETFLIFLSRLM